MSSARRIVGNGAAHPAIPPRIEAKEVDLEETEKVINQTADEPPKDPYFYQFKKGNEKP
jgi:hypothetical protein